MKVNDRDVPPGVTTVTGTRTSPVDPGGRGGALTVIWLAVGAPLTLPVRSPNLTCSIQGVVGPVKPLPAITTCTASSGGQSPDGVSFLITEGVGRRTQRRRPSNSPRSHPAW